MEVLLAATARHSEDLHHQAIVLSARYHAWAKEQRMGLGEQDSELNRIHLSMLELNRLLGNASPRRPARLIASPWLWAGLVLGLLMTLGGIWASKYFQIKEVRENYPGWELDEQTDNPGREASVHPGPQEMVAAYSTWRIKAQPFATPARMTVAGAKLATISPSARELRLVLDVTNEGEGWHPVQLVSSMFLLEQAGKAKVTSTDLAVLSIEPGATATVELAFEVEGSGEELILIIRQQEGEAVRIPLNAAIKK